MSQVHLSGYSNHQLSTSATSSPSCSTTTGYNTLQSTRSGPPVSFLIHRILAILESSKSTIRLSHLETQLVRDLHQLQQATTGSTAAAAAYQQYDLRGDTELLRALECNPRVHFNRFKNELSYINPFEGVTSESALLHRVRYADISGTTGGSNNSSIGGVAGGSGGVAPAGMAGSAFPGCGLGGLYGLKVSTDVLSGHPDMKTFIRNLLAHKKVRAIRPPYLREAKVKCLLAASNNNTTTTSSWGMSSNIPGSEGCSLYDKEKCKECFDNLKGCFLYCLGDDETEGVRLQLDDDVRQVWLGIKMPAMDEILEEQNVVVQQRKYKWMNPTAEERKTLVMLKRKRRRMEQKQNNSNNAAGAGKLRKIQNTHLFTAQQMRSEMLQQQ
eukprot:GHVS01010161.1.p1 GENE.GHVS01010161.1~~GHVS01010161.1.p1  ORF type:complete len:384 (+),score=73.64 GHVS01010161.1:162-1313(+)